jgi:hypothetical protein
VNAIANKIKLNAIGIAILLILSFAGTLAIMNAENTRKAPVPFELLAIPEDLAPSIVKTGFTRQLIINAIDPENVPRITAINERPLQSAIQITIAPKIADSAMNPKFKAVSGCGACNMLAITRTKNRAGNCQNLGSISLPFDFSLIHKITASMLTEMMFSLDS